MSNSDEKTEDTMPADTNHPDRKSESTMNPDNVNPNQNAESNEAIDTDEIVQKYSSEIMKAYGSSVGAIIKTGTIIVQAKDQLDVSFTLLEEALGKLGFKRTVLSCLGTISKNPVLSLPGKLVPPAQRV